MRLTKPEIDGWMPSLWLLWQSDSFSGRIMSFRAFLKTESKKILPNSNPHSSSLEARQCRTVEALDLPPSGIA
jgi:hypothetical protein